MNKTPQGEAPIEVVAYDPQWQSKFEVERRVVAIGARSGARGPN